MVDRPKTYDKSDTELNLELQALLEEALSLPDKSAQRRKTLNKFFTLIQRSGQLGFPLRGQISPQRYDDLYQEALQKTRLYLSRKLDQYHPNFPVMAWVNQVLKWRLQDVWDKRLKDARRTRPWSLEEVANNFQQSVATYYDQKQAEAVIERQQQQQQQQDDQDRIIRLRTLIKTHELFQQVHIRGYPDACFGSILLFKMNGETYQEIATRYQLNRSTISTFYDRKLKKYIPELRKYLEGYESIFDS